MGRTTADVVICGAGIAGISAAYHLTLLQPGLRVVVVDERPPLSLTSDKSTECYRNWWPEASMIHLIDRSVFWLQRWADETGNAFGLNRRGYLYASTTDDGARGLLVRAEHIARLGGGELHISPSPGIDPRGLGSAGVSAGASSGAEFCSDPAAIQAVYPYLAPGTLAVLRVHRAGWFRAQELGTWLLGKAALAGVARLAGRLTRLEIAGGAVKGLQVETPAGAHHISAPILVNAAGPFASEVSEWAGVELPLSWELHLKAAFQDLAQIVPRSAPLLILADEQRLEWSEEELALLRQSPADRNLLEPLPGGAHLRPEGPADSRYCLLLWPYHLPSVLPTFPIVPDPAYAEIAMRGMSRLILGLRVYIGRMPPTSVDGGYYTRTPDNLPLIGPTPLGGYFLMAALSGFGVMASPAAGELLARSVLGQDLPGYADSFLLRRLEARGYWEQLRRAQETGGL